jgi:hypothetical protein
VELSRNGQYFFLDTAHVAFRDCHRQLATDRANFAKNSGRPDGSTVSI